MREYIGKALKGESSDIRYNIGMLIKGVDISPVSLSDLNLSHNRSNFHEATVHGLLEQVLDDLRITPKDAILDLGCGKGAAIITFAKYPFMKIAGVDISPSILKIAENNFRRLKVKNIILYCQDAGDFSQIDEFNYIYIYNPFPCRVLEEVMKHLIISLEQYPRQLIIIYNNPVCHEIISKIDKFDHINTVRYKGYCIFIYKYNLSIPFPNQEISN